MTHIAIGIVSQCILHNCPVALMCTAYMYDMISMVCNYMVYIINSYSLLCVHTGCLLKGEQTGEFCSIANVNSCNCFFFSF